MRLLLPRKEWGILRQWLVGALYFEDIRGYQISRYYRDRYIGFFWLPLQFVPFALGLIHVQAVLALFASQDILHDIISLLFQQLVEP